MNVSQIAKSTQEQAAASWIDHLNQLRLDRLIARLAAQDINLGGALEELQKLKDFVGDPLHILGNDSTKHGEIAEHVQVNISNARKIIEGLKGEYTFEGVGRTAPEDYLHNGLKVQSKFINGLFGNNSFAHITNHLKDYPDFIANGGTYDIPKDQYDNIIRYLRMSPEELKNIPSTSEDGGTTIRNLVKNIRDWETKNNTKFEDSVKPAVADYKDVQQGKIGDTINKEESSLKEKDKEQRDNAHQQSKPSLKEGATVTAVSAVIEGGMSFCLGVAKKLRSGKKLNEFTAQDWKDVGIDTAKGTGKGVIRGASIYGLTNFTSTPASVASAMVTATFGVVAQANLLRQGKISAEEFIENSEVVCLDVTVSAIASVIGQVAIPIPILGAVIGNAVGMFMYGIAKDSLSKQEQQLIFNFNNTIDSLNAKLNEQYKALIELLKYEFAKFQSVVALAFDLDVNIAFAGSVELAQYVGCLDEKILKNKDEIDNYFRK